MYIEGFIRVLYPTVVCLGKLVHPQTLVGISKVCPYRAPSMFCEPHGVRMQEAAKVVSSSRRWASTTSPRGSSLVT